MKKIIFTIFLFMLGLLIACEPVQKKVCIDWADVIKINNTVYNNSYSRVITDEKIIDKEFEVIKFKVAENVNDPEYKLRDGDATFLQPGTKVYSVKGYDKDKAAAVKVGVNWILYTAQGYKEENQEDKDDYNNTLKLIVENLDGSKFEIVEKDKIMLAAKQLKEASSISQMPSMQNEKRYNFYFVINDKDGIGKISTKYYFTYQDNDSDAFVEDKGRILKLDSSFSKILTAGFIK